MSTRIEIKLSFSGTRQQVDDWAFSVIGQDPMGGLGVPVLVQVGGIVAEGQVTGFTSGGASRDYVDAVITVEVWA